MQTIKKILWGCFVSIQLALAIIVTIHYIQSWNDSPIVTAVSQKDVSNISFPAVTLCVPIKWECPGINTLQSYFIVDPVNNVNETEIRTKLIPLFNIGQVYEEATTQPTILAFLEKLFGSKSISLARWLHYIFYRILDCRTCPVTFEKL